MDNLTVFLSSTSKDLGDYRDAVYDSIEGLDGFHCVRMENFGARDAEPNEFDPKRVKECDVFVAIIGKLYGSRPQNNSELSFTESEYDAAVKLRKPCLIFLSSDDFTLPANLREGDELYHRQEQFRKKATAKIIDRFSDRWELAAKVVKALRNHERETQANTLPQDVSLVLIPCRTLLIFGELFVFVSGGFFPMGSENGLPHERPRHRVGVSSFFLAASPLRNRAFSRFVEETRYPTTTMLSGAGLTLQGNDDWAFDPDADWQHPQGAGTSLRGRDDHPVVQVSWFDAREYCDWLSRKTGFAFGLPTEAQWEYAAAGSCGRIWAGGDHNTSKTMNIQSRETSRVGRYPANEPGLYDMSGNVYEWCQDWYASSWADANHRFDGNTIDPPGAPAGTLRVLRGGSWYDTFSCARCAHRFHAEPTLTAANWGFRCRLSVNETLLEWLGQGDRWGISNEEMRVLRESSDE